MLCEVFGNFVTGWRFTKLFEKHLLTFFLITFLGGVDPDQTNSTFRRAMPLVRPSTTTTRPTATTRPTPRAPIITPMLNSNSFNKVTSKWADTTTRLFLGLPSLSSVLQQNRRPRLLHQQRESKHQERIQFTGPDFLTFKLHCLP